MVTDSCHRSKILLERLVVCSDMSPGLVYRASGLLPWLHAVCRLGHCHYCGCCYREQRCHLLSSRLSWHVPCVRLAAAAATAHRTGTCTTHTGGLHRWSVRGPGRGRGAGAAARAGVEAPCATAVASGAPCLSLSLSLSCRLVWKVGCAQRARRPCPRRLLTRRRPCGPSPPRRRS